MEIKFKKRISLWLLGSLLLSCNVFATDAAPETSSANTEKSFDGAPKIGVPYTSKFRGPDPNPTSSNSFLNPADREAGSKPTFVGNVLDNIQLSGTIRLLTIYRNMKSSYADMKSSPKNLSIYDYPIASAGSSVGGGFPQLELNLTSRISPRFLFNVGYSFASTMTGDAVGSGGRAASSRQNLFFNGKVNAGAVRFDISAGGILWTGLSAFTMGQPQYRDSYFNRMPWDWYRNSFLRYDEYYTLSRNVGSEANGRSPLIGFVAKTDILPIGVKITTLYGRTNTNVPVGLATQHYPSSTLGIRAEKIIFTRYVAGKVGLNYRGRYSQASPSNETKDLQKMLTLDFDLRIRKVRIAGEIGTSIIENRNIGDSSEVANVKKYDLDNGTSTLPLTTYKKQGFGGSLKIELDRDLTALPISVEGYYINKWMISQDGSIINSNSKALLQNSDQLYDLFFQQNLAQEIGILCNNRWGANVKLEKTFGKLKTEFGAAWSSDIENLGDTVTFQHRVSAFSRSRFHPWFNAGGNYGRLKSNWMRTYEIVTITDKANGINTDYKKSYSAVELFLKYKINVFNRDLVLLNFNSYNSVDAGAKALGTTDASFIRVFFEDFTAAYKLTKKVAVSGNVGFERALGGARTQETFIGSGKHINQTGWNFALGLDYDFTRNAGIHIRHTWLRHKDKNFVLDEYKGTETNIELKIFF